MAKDSITYRPLSVSDEETFTADVTPTRLSYAWLRRLLLVVTAVSITLNMVFMGFWLSHRGPSNPIFPQALYSPGQDVVEYKTVKFQTAFGNDTSIYDGPPSDEVDAAWNDLYKFAISKVPKSQAARMVNKTYPIQGEEDYYMASLDVFHQLHCLNKIRQALHSDYYPPMYADANGLNVHRARHIPHCLAILRQSLMCFSDISPVVWQWSDEAQVVKNRVDVVHTCRNFDRIRDWAEEHRLRHTVDFKVRIDDDIEIPTF